MCFFLVGFSADFDVHKPFQTRSLSSDLWNRSLPAVNWTEAGSNNQTDMDSGGQSVREGTSTSASS